MTWKHARWQRSYLQGIMDKSLFEVCGMRKGEQDVCMQSANKSPSKPKPLVIHFTRDVFTHKPRGFQPIPVKKPTPFPYKSDKAVPWKYTAQRPDRRKEESFMDDLSSTKVTNLLGTSGITRSGQMWAWKRAARRARFWMRRSRPDGLLRKKRTLAKKEYPLKK